MVIGRSDTVGKGFPQSYLEMKKRIPKDPCIQINFDLMPRNTVREDLPWLVIIDSI